MAARSSRWQYWWQNSRVYSLLAGSFFLRWLVGGEEREVDYLSTSRIAQGVEKIVTLVLKWLYLIGDVLAAWLEGSLIVRYWLSVLGVMVLMLTVAVLRLSSSWGLAISLALIGLGMAVARTPRNLVEGSYLGRLTTWWLRDN